MKRNSTSLFLIVHVKTNWRLTASLPGYWTSSLLGPMLWMSCEDSEAALYAWIRRFLFRSPTPLPACILGYGGVSATWRCPRPWASMSISWSRGQPSVPSATGENSWALACSSLDTGLMETDGELKDTMMTETGHDVYLHFSKHDFRVKVSFFSASNILKRFHTSQPQTVNRTDSVTLPCTVLKPKYRPS